MVNIGKPKIILSDHGPQFISGRQRQTLGWEGIIPKHTAVYHPQSNQAERVMREIGRIFRAYCHAKCSEWPLYMKKVERWLNSTTHDSTRFTPYELIKGTRPRRILEQLFNYPPENQTIDVNVKIQLANESLLTKGERRKHRHDAKGTKYEVWQLVLVRRHNLPSAQDKAVSYTQDVYKRQIFN